MLKRAVNNKTVVRHCVPNGLMGTTEDYVAEYTFLETYQILRHGRSLR